MRLEIGLTQYEVDVERTRDYYNALPYVSDAVTRNHVQAFEKSASAAQKAAFERIGITNPAGMLRDRAFYVRHTNSVQHMYDGSSFYPLYPVICRPIRKSKFDRSRSIDASNRKAGLKMLTLPLIAIYGTADFERLLPYYPNIVLLSFDIPEPWVLDEPLPDDVGDMPENEIVSDNASGMLETMLTLRGAKYEALTCEQWNARVMRCVDAFIKPDMRAEVRDGFLETLEREYTHSLSLWHYLTPQYSPNALEGDAAESAFDTRSSCDYNVCLEGGEFIAFHVHGRLPMARQFKRFRRSDLYVLPDDMSWIFARNHEECPPNFVAAMPKQEETP